MNGKNAVFVVLGIAVFVGLLVVVWGSGGKKKAGPTPAPVRASQQESSKAEQPVKPAPVPLPKPIEPAPLPVEPVKPGPDVVQPKPVEPTPDKPPVEPASATTERPRITADTGVVEESAIDQAAGAQELPMTWLKKDQQPEVDPDAPKPLPKTYVVRSVTTLYRVANEIYGDPKKWTLLFEANKAVLEDPEKVAEGTVLTVPDPSQADSTPAPEKKKKSGVGEGVF